RRGLTTEGTAHDGVVDVYGLGGKSESAREVRRHEVRSLVAGVHGEQAVGPYRQRGVRFERRMVLRGRLVGCVDGHVARGERVLDGLDTVGQDGQGRRYLPGRGLRVDGGVDAVGERRGRGPFVVGDLGEGGGV